MIYLNVEGAETQAGKDASDVSIRNCDGIGVPVKIEHDYV